MIRACAASLLVAFLALGAPGGSQRINLFPQLRAGQAFTYHISYHSDKQVQTESAIVSTSPPENEKVDVQALLRLEILSLQPQGEGSIIHARTRFDLFNADPNFKTPGFAPPSAQVQRERPIGKFVEFAIYPGGRIDDIQGLDTLFPEQQQAWQEWASRFALAATFPAGGVKPKQKLRTEEPEKSPSPIAGLVWSRESVYMDDQPCGAVNMSAQSELAPSDGKSDSCAVILTTATLKQQSSSTNATPEAFKVRELRTTGAARGTNRIITYISRNTGLVVRSTEEAHQNMDVTIAKSDRTNRVRYKVTAKSHCEVLLVNETALNDTDLPSR